MKKLILFFMMLFSTIAYSQVDPWLLSKGFFGNLYTLAGKGILTSTGLGFKVLGGTFTLTQTGVQLQAILDGTISVPTVFDSSVTFDPHGAASLDGAVTADINIATSFESWWGAVTIRNYYNSGYTDRPNPGTQSVGIEQNQIIIGTGSPSPAILSIVSKLDFQKFTGTYATNQDALGLINYFIAPEVNIANNPRNIWLNESYFESVGTEADTVIPSGSFRGYSFRIAGNNTTKLGGTTYAYYSDMASGSGKLVGATDYHFYGKGDYPVYFGGDLFVDGAYNFGADAQADDDYEVSLPEISTLTTGMTATFIANTANTGGATLEITEVGDLDAILKLHDQPLITGDIEAGQVVVLVWDGTNWQMTSQLAQ